jgi:protein gp37
VSTATSIEWTRSDDGSAGATWNPVTGCDRISRGCDHCYALRLAGRLKAMGQARYQTDGDPRTSGPGLGVALHPEALGEPLRWRKPRRIFVNSMSDLFHARVPWEFVARVWATMALARQYTFQILTKRPERMLRLLAEPHRTSRFLGMVASEGEALRPGCLDGDGLEWPLPNVWLGTSVEDADVLHRVDTLRQVRRARVADVQIPEVAADAFDLPTGGVHDHVRQRRRRARRHRADPWEIHPAVHQIAVGARELTKLSHEEGCCMLPPPDHQPSGQLVQSTVQWGAWVPDDPATIAAEAAAVDGGGRLRRRVGLLAYVYLDGGYDTGLRSGQATSRILTTSMLPAADPDRHDYLAALRPARMRRVGKAHAGNRLDGHAWQQFPNPNPNPNPGPDSAGQGEEGR